MARISCLAGRKSRGTVLYTVRQELVIEHAPVPPRALAELLGLTVAFTAFLCGIAALSSLVP